MAGRISKASYTPSSQTTESKHGSLKVASKLKARDIAPKDPPKQGKKLNVSKPLVGSNSPPKHSIQTHQVKQSSKKRVRARKRKKIAPKFAKHKKDAIKSEFWADISHEFGEEVANCLKRSDFAQVSKDKSAFSEFDVDTLRRAASAVKSFAQGNDQSSRDDLAKFANNLLGDALPKSKALQMISDAIATDGSIKQPKFVTQVLLKTDFVSNKTGNNEPFTPMEKAAIARTAKRLDRLALEVKPKPAQAILAFTADLGLLGHSGQIAKRLHQIQRELGPFKPDALEETFDSLIASDFIQGKVDRNENLSRAETLKLWEVAMDLCYLPFTSSSPETASLIVNSKLNNSRAYDAAWKAIDSVTDIDWQQEVLLHTDLVREKLTSGHPFTQTDLDKLELATANLKTSHALDTNRRLANRATGKKVDLSDAKQLGTILGQLAAKLDTLNVSQGNGSAFTKSIQDLKNAAAHARNGDASASKIGDLLKAVAKLENNLNKLPKLSKQSGDFKILQRTVSSLKHRINYEAKLAATEAFKVDLRKRLAHLKLSGTESNYSLDVNVGIDARLLGFKVAGAETKIRFSFKAAAHDDTKIRQFGSAKLSVATKLGNDKIVSAGSHLGGTLSTGKAFNSLDDFVDHHANGLLASMLSADISDVKGVMQAKKAVALESRSVNENRQLTNDLKHLGLITGDLALARYKKPTYTSVNKRGIDSGIAAKGGKGIGKLFGKPQLVPSFGASVAVHNTRVDFTKRTKLLDALKLQSELNHRDNPTYYRVGPNFMAENTNQSMKQWDEFETTIDQLRKSKNKDALVKKRSELQNAIKEVFADYDSYAYVVNLVNGKSRPEINSGAKSIKSSYEQSRSTGSSEEYLKALTMNHEKLSKLYEKTFLAGETPASNDPIFDGLRTEFESAYRVPQFNLNESRAKKHLKIESKNVGNVFKVDAKMAAELKAFGIGGKIEIAATTTDVTNDGNPDNDGTYRNYSLVVSSGSSVKGIISAIQKATKGNDETEDIQVDPSEWKFLDEVSTDLTLESDSKIELNLKKSSKGTYKIQYLRVCSSGQMGFGAQVPIPLTAMTGGSGIDLNVGVKVNSTQSTNRFEALGNHTMSYLIKKFNGLMAAQATDSWNELVAGQTKTFQKLFRHLGRDASTAYMELDASFHQMDEHKVEIPVGFQAKLKSEMRKYREDNSATNFKAAQESFETFLRLNNKAFKAEAATRFKRKT